MQKPSKEEVSNFIQESNLIEGIADKESHDQALLAWDYLLSVDTISPATVRNVHATLMRNQGLSTKYLGEFRDCDVYVGGRVCLPPSDIADLIGDWCKHMNKGTADDIELHVLYENIHPFVDGNGRTGRMFWQWYRLKRGLPLYELVAEDVHSRAHDYYSWF